MADAAVAAGASLLIWSSLPHISKITNGKYTRILHFDSKAEVEIYIRDLPIKSTFFLAGFYMQNFKTMFRPKIVSCPPVPSICLAKSKLWRYSNTVLAINSLT